MKDQKKMKKLENLSCEERLREPGLFSLQMGRLMGAFLNVYKYPKEGCKEYRDRLSTVVPRARTRGKWHKLKDGKFPLNIRKHFFVVQVPEYWHRLHCEAVESLPGTYSEADWT